MALPVEAPSYPGALDDKPKGSFNDYKVKEMREMQVIARPWNEPTSRRLSFEDEELPAKQPYPFFEPADADLANALRGSFLHDDFMALEKADEPPATQVDSPEKAKDSLVGDRPRLLRQNAMDWTDSQLNEPSPFECLEPEIADGVMPDDAAGDSAADNGILDPAAADAGDRGDQPGDHEKDNQSVSLSQFGLPWFPSQ